jgi:hypothetical protein
MPSKIDHEWSIIAREGVFAARLFTVGAVAVTGATPVADQDPLASRFAALVITLDHQLFAKRLSEYLNRTVHHNGSWQVGFAHPDPVDQAPTEMVMRWRDADDDIQLRVFVEGKLPTIAAMDLKDFAGDAEIAWSENREVKHRWLGIKPSQTILAAQGEGRALPHIRGPRIFGA